MANHFKVCKICSKKTLKKAWSSRADKQDLEGGSSPGAGPVFPPFHRGIFQNGEKIAGDELLGVELPFEPLWNLSEGRDFGDWA